MIWTTNKTPKSKYLLLGKHLKPVTEVYRLLSDVSGLNGKIDICIWIVDGVFECDAEKCERVSDKQDRETTIFH